MYKRNKTYLPWYTMVGRLYKNMVNISFKFGLFFRAPGVYGVVNVPYKVITPSGSEDVDDLTPASGYVTFKDREVFLLDLFGNLSLFLFNYFYHTTTSHTAD